MLNRRGLLAGAAALAASPVLAAGDDPMDVASTALAAGEGYDPDAEIEQRMQDFIEQAGFGAKKRAGTLFVEFGKATVKVGSENLDWVKFRASAYAEALLDAQAKLVSEQSTSIKTQTAQKFLKGVDEPPAYTPSATPNQVVEVIQKVLAVASGRLDNELRDLGIDPKAYDAAPPAQKTAMLNDHLHRTVTTRSIGDTISACPVKTFEGHDANGHYCVGVVIVTSSRVRDLVKQIASARGDFAPDPARAQDLRTLYADPKALLADFGVRQLFDEQGLPVIVSFAQWASSYRGPDAAMAATYREAARRQAELAADGQIADFVKGSVTYDRSGTTGQEIDRIASVLPDSATIDETKKAIDEQRRSIILTAQVQLTGLTTLRNWTAVHPASKIPIVGVIRIWSAVNEKAMRTMMGSSAARRSTAAASAPPGTAGATESRQLMKSEDF